MADLDIDESCCSAAKCVELEANGVEMMHLGWQDCEEQILNEVQHAHYCSLCSHCLPVAPCSLLRAHTPHCCSYHHALTTYCAHCALTTYGSHPASARL